MNNYFFFKSTLFLLVVVLFSIMLSCNKTHQEEQTKRIIMSGNSYSLSSMNEKMSEIYANMRQERMDFDSCAVVEQENGYTIVVAYGKRDTMNVSFAVLAEKNGNDIYVRDTPTSSCTCEGNCQKGCDPEYLGEGNKWMCTQCEFTHEVEPVCIRSVTAIPNPKE